MHISTSVHNTHAKTFERYQKKYRWVSMTLAANNIVAAGLCQVFIFGG
jgi:hypothetical protein